MRDDSNIILEGRLESISEVGTKSGEHYTILSIGTRSRIEKVNFKGIVFPDSIGHRVQVYERTLTVKQPSSSTGRLGPRERVSLGVDVPNRDVSTVIEMFDVDNERWYK